MAVRHKNLILLVAAATCMSLAACGSALTPEQAQLANGTTNGEAGGGADSGGQGGVLGGGTAVGGAGGGAGKTKSPGSAGGGTTGGTTGGGSGGTGGTTGGGTTGGGATGGGSTGGSSGGGGIAAGNCAGFKNDKGITDKQITIAQVADISGPVPGLFKSTQDATKAFVAYFNSTIAGGICGRTLNLVTEDSQTSDGGDQAAAIDACSKAFALVGSMSAFDTGGAQTATNCGLPDIRTSATTTGRFHAPNSFGAYSLAPNLVPAAEPNTFKKLFPGVEQRAAMLYLNAGSASINGKSFKAAYAKAGFNYVYEQGLDVTELSYDTYINAMYNKNVTFIGYTGAYQNGIKLAKAIATKRASDPKWKPIFEMDSVAYDPDFPPSGGSAVEGTISFTSSGLFEAPTPELNLYTQWLQRVSPGSKPTFFGQYAWSAARLFTDTALKLGGKLNRQTLLDAIKATRSWTGHGMHAASDVGGKRTPECTAILQLKGGRWVNVGGGNPYLCEGVIDSGTGG